MSFIFCQSYCCWDSTHCACNEGGRCIVIHHCLNYRDQCLQLGRYLCRSTSPQHPQRPLHHPSVMVHSPFVALVLILWLKKSLLLSFHRHLLSYSHPSFYMFLLPFPLVQENINIDEAANCLVKHIIASENDMLQSEVPDTITPQLEKDKGGTCSSCFRSQ